jgi:uncharacterized protein
MNWIKEIFRTTKPIIAMCHMPALPGDPGYDPAKGLEWVLEHTKKDLLALQEGGVDAVMFSNESSLPYLTKVEPITTTVMARIIAELFPLLRVPFGVNVLWDAEASIDLAVATGALFIREIISGVYASDFGLWNTNAGKTARHQRVVSGQNVKLLYNIVPEAASYLGHREIADVARSTVFNCQPDALCVSGITAGRETSASTLRLVKEAVPETPVFANTGVRLSNVAEQLAIADGAVVGTSFKTGGHIWNEVDANCVREFMCKVNETRK